MEMFYLQENKFYELHNLYNENKGFVCGELVEKYDIFKNLVAEIFFLAHSRQFMSVKLQFFCKSLSFTKVVLCFL